MNQIKYEHVVCECHSLEHQYVFLVDEEDNFIYVIPHLFTYKSFWKRLLYAIKYIFGYKSIHGSFDEFIVNPETAEEICKIFQKIIKK